MYVRISLALFILALYSAAPGVLRAEEQADASTAATRQRPGGEERQLVFPPFVYESVPDINSSASEFVPVPDRWRQLYVDKWYDPYNQNVRKGDIPVFGEPGEEWFFSADLISDSLFETLKLPLPVGAASTENSGSNNTFGKRRINLFNENLAMSFALIKGNTTFKPPDFELRIAPVINYNHADAPETGVLQIDPARGDKRDNFHIALQELFFDYHIANLSERFDFISTRVGIQRFQSDFRGFIFSDDALGARLFGNYDNNINQFNLAWFTRLEKDTNSNLNSNFDLRHEDVVVANYYRQDLLMHGHQVQGSVIYRTDRAGDYAPHYDDNGVLRRPAAIGDERSKNIDNVYLGLNSDGHLGRLNTTSAFYLALGRESHNSIAGRETDIRAGMIALEASYDIDWIRPRVSFLWATGDKDPYDSTASGFDSIFDLPNFAGGDLSFWQRQAIPLVAGGEVFLVNRNSLLPDLRAGKEEGQSNFVNPGLRLFNAGVDFDLTPKFTLVTNATFLQFDETATLNVVRQDGSFSRDIGVDLSAGLLYRPFLNNNVQVRAGAATLLPAAGLKGLYGDDELYHVFSDLILQY